MRFIADLSLIKRPKRVVKPLIDDLYSEFRDVLTPQHQQPDAVQAFSNVIKPQPKLMGFQNAGLSSL